MARIESLTVVQDPAHAALVLHHFRQQILEHLAEPSSAAGIARRLGLPRQRVNYHLRELEKAGFLELVEERRRGNCLERVVRAKAKSYLISPQALGKLGTASDEPQDGFSASYLMTLASKAIREVAFLSDQPRTAGTRLATISLETRVRFKDAAGRNAFAEELATALGRLVAKYNHESDGGGRVFQFLLAGYPTPGGTEVSPAAKGVDSAP